MASMGTTSTNSGQTIGPAITESSPRSHVKKVRPIAEVTKSQQEVKGMRK
jgi:hypothetical protein